MAKKMDGMIEQYTDGWNDKIKNKNKNNIRMDGWNKRKIYRWMDGLRERYNNMQ